MIKFFGFMLFFVVMLVVGFGLVLEGRRASDITGFDNAQLGDEIDINPDPGRPTIELGHDPMDGILGRQGLSEMIDERANR